MKLFHSKTTNTLEMCWGYCVLTVVGDFPDPFLHLQKMSLFFFLFCLCNQRQLCLHCYSYSYIYLWLYCACGYVCASASTSAIFLFSWKSKVTWANCPPVKVACPVHVVYCQACTCKETSCCEVTVLTTATRSATDTVLLVYVMSQSGLASYLPYRHKSGACTAV